MAESKAVKAPRERVAKWDNIKFVLIFLVVLGHFVNELIGRDYNPDIRLLEEWNFYVYTFHMPAFIFLSGLFSKKNIDNKRMDKIGGYLLLYLAMQLVIFTGKFIAYGKAGFSLLSEVGVPWYALAIFFMSSFMVLLKPYNKKVVIIGAFLMGLLIGYDKSLSSYLAIQRTFTFFPFFVAGYYFEINKLLEFIEKKWVKLASAVILVGYGLLVHFGIEKIYFMYYHFLKARAPYRNTFKKDIMGDFWNSYGFLYRIGFYVVAFIITFAFFSIIPKAKNICTKIGSRTISIYAIHYAFVDIIMSGLGLTKILKDMTNQFAVFGIIFAISVALTIILSEKHLAGVFTTIMSTPNSNRERN